LTIGKSVPHYPKISIPELRAVFVIAKLFNSLEGFDGNLTSAYKEGRAETMDTDDLRDFQ
jgi:hypothetical protein